MSNTVNILDKKPLPSGNQWYLTALEKESVYVPNANTNLNYKPNIFGEHRADRNDFDNYSFKALNIVDSLPKEAAETMPKGVSEFGTHFIKWRHFDIESNKQLSYWLGIGGASAIGWNKDKSERKYVKSSDGFYDLSENGNGKVPGWKTIEFYIYNSSESSTTFRLAFRSHNDPANEKPFLTYFFPTTRKLILLSGWNHVVLYNEDFMPYSNASWEKITHVDFTVADITGVIDENDLYFSSIKMYDYRKGGKYLHLIKNSAVFTVGGHRAFIDDSEYLSSPNNTSARAFRKDGLYFISANILASAKGSDASFSPDSNKLSFNYNEKSYFIGEGFDNNLEFTLTAPAIAKNGAIFLSHKDMMTLFGYKNDFIGTNGLIVLSNEKINLDNSSDYDYDIMKCAAEDLIFVRPDKETIRADLAENATAHPYIIMKEPELEKLREYYKTDEIFKGYVERIDAEYGVESEIFKGPVADYNIPDGLRLLFVSREVLAKTMSWSTLYTIYKKDKPELAKQFAERIWLELEAVSHFVDWNPRHYGLDGAELSYPIGVCYDRLYDYWTPERRGVIEGILYGFSLKITTTLGGNLNAYAYSPTRYFNNLNSVSNAGLMIAALALVNVQNDVTWKQNSATIPTHGEVGVKSIELVDENGVGPEFTTEKEVIKYTTKAEDVREDALKLISELIPGTERSLWTYAPDGAYQEGPGYWGFGTTYLHVFISALDSACGTNYGVYYAPGLEDSAYFIPYCSNRGEIWKFHDASGFDASTMILAWFAKKSGDSNLGWIRRNYIKNNWGSIKLNYYDVLHYDPTLVADKVSLPKDRLYVYDTVMTFRDSWDSENSLFTGLHGGSNNIGHGDYDVGNFNLKIGEHDMITDFGQGNYNLLGMGQPKQRYGFYRKRAEGHNTLVMRPTGTSWAGTTGDPGEDCYTSNSEISHYAQGDQLLLAYSKCKKFESNDTSSFGVIDMKVAYPYMTEGQRGLYFGDNRSTVIIQDEAKFSESMDVWWFAHTMGEIIVSDDKKSAVFSYNGKHLYAQLITEQDAEFTVMSADSLDKYYPMTHFRTRTDKNGRNDHQDSDKYRKLTVKLTNVTDMKLAVAFKVIESPNDIPKGKIYSFKNIADWQLEI